MMIVSYLSSLSAQGPIIMDPGMDLFLCFTSIGNFLSSFSFSAQCNELLMSCWQSDDTKAFKSFYQSLIENLRQQQNGSLVFR